jgi:broad specificity phosphatase PhoE
MKIYVVRHGITELNKKHALNGWIDEPLAEEGFKQAEILRDALPEDIKVIYASSLLRARQTAEIINRRFRVPITYHDELREMSSGTLSGKTFAEIEKEHGVEYGREKFVRLEYDYRQFQGESVEEVRNRVHKIIDEIKSSHREGGVLLVTHGGVVRLIEHDYHQRIPEDTPHGQIVEIEG